MSLDKLLLPTVKKSEKSFSFPLGFIQLDTLTLPNGEDYPYYSLNLPPFSVMVLATTKEDRLIINEEYRHPTRKILLSLPGGLVDPEEPPLSAAKREFLEETGYTADHFEIMGSAYPFPGMSNQMTYFIKAVNAFPTSNQTLESSEFIRTTEKSYDQLIQEITSGVDTDCLLCTALFLYSIKKNRFNLTDTNR